MVSVTAFNSAPPHAPRPPLPEVPLVSCLTVTQPGRQTLLARAVGDFFRQRYARKALLVLHDGGNDWHRECEALVARCASAALPLGETQATVVQVDAGESLGALRNRAVDSARGDLVCQWDDDDRSHPDRLGAQVQALMREGASACYLETQLHRFADSGEWLVEDWSLQPYPRNLVQGSALVRRDTMPRYAEVQRGEDTALLHALIEAREPIARVRNQPWLYCYSYHGGNSFDRAHHAAIARDTQISPAGLVNLRKQLERELAAFDPAIGL
jgi:Glycosyl transferase family 2